ncbi:MAG TPA: polymer-forming cytoskeletal protein [Saprospirales bacterium]|nr:polymer-forming cytoskeletal protein [Saprospirales bacterium]
MFGTTKETEDSKKSAVSTSPASALNALVKGTAIEGTVRCDSDLRVDGAIKGKLSCTSKVIIGPTGAVDGEIRCQNAVIEGQFKGKLYVAELLNVRETAEIDGDVTTSKLVVQSGAKFNVACKMEPGSANGTIKHFESKNTNDGTGTATKAVATGTTEVRN